MDCFPNVLCYPIHHAVESGYKKDPQDLCRRLFNSHDRGMARPLPDYYAGIEPEPYSFRFYRDWDFRRVFRCLPALYQNIPE